MHLKSLARVTLLSGLILFFNLCIAQQKTKPRILVSSDIGGTDPDDFQSMIHLLMYANEFQIEGLVSSPYGNGRKKDILHIIDLYEKDLPKLRSHSKGFPAADRLRALCKQGVIPEAPFIGYRTATEGSNWIIKCAKKKSIHPLWVLVWGGLEDLAQALHDAPEIKKNIMVYWIGGPNKKWSVNAYAYIAKAHPDLWMIEANATYRGWMMDEDSPEHLKGKAYYGNYIKGRGAMGKDFINYYQGEIKMGDTPSLAYLLNGNPYQPTGESWGGSFMPVNRSSRIVFNRNTTLADTVPTYAVMEWVYKGPYMNIALDSACFWLTINAQTWPGYYLGNGTFGIRYAPKQAETGTYIITSAIPFLNGQKGQYVAIAQWPGKPGAGDYNLGKSWYSDRIEAELFFETQQGAKTVSKHREAFLLDWAQRWAWLDED